MTDYTQASVSQSLFLFCYIATLLLAPLSQYIVEAFYFACNAIVIVKFGAAAVLNSIM